MPISIVYDYPSPARLRRFFSRLMRFLGACLLVAGLITAVPTFFSLLEILDAIFTGTLPELRTEELLNAGTVAAYTLVFLLLGRWLLKGRRRLVLFLRRFGFVGATEALTFALASIGSSWRVITLDDNQVAAVGTGRNVRWTTVGGGIIAIVIPAGALVWARSGGLESALKGNRVNPGDPGWAQIVESFFVLMVVVAVVIVIMFFVCFFVLLGLVSLGGYISVRRAEISKRVQVLSLQAIEPVVRSVARRTRRVISPKLIVVRVAVPVWQETVRRLAGVCGAIVIDISEPTPNLLWEIATLKPDLRFRWILVAEQQNLSRLMATDALDLDLNHQLLDVLDGESVLAYSSDRSGRKRFARALRNRLDALSRSDMRTPA